MSLAISPAVIHIVKLSETAAGYLRIMFFMCSFNLIGYAINCVTISEIFCAGRDSKFGLCCDSVVMWCIAVPAGLIAAFWLKLPVVWVFFIVNLDELLKVPAVYVPFATAS